ncbi:MAG TPA: magnesium transporter [Chthoniobacteraceae bacterium]|nr:magnesium transporter [Chthoniobacteraceae bacterium]
MFGALIQPEIRALINEGNFHDLKQIFVDWAPVDLAELIADLPEEERVVIFRLLPSELATETFEYLDLESQQHLLRAMGQGEVVAVLNAMSPDDRTAFLEELPSNVVTQLLRLLTPEERAIAQSLLNYPEESVGRLMTPDFLAVRDEWTIGEVLDYIRVHGKDSETLNVIYVVDEKGRLVDDLRISRLLIKPLEMKIAEIRDENFVALSVNDPQREAVEAFKKYDRSTLPVLDGRGVLVGIVTIDDVIDVAEEETTRNIQKLGGTEALDEPYLSTSILEMVHKRGTWLVVLFLGQLLTATAMGYFESAIEKTVLLSLFLPLIISSGGNCGSQASTLIIRAMAVGEVRLRDWFRVMRKELAAGLMLGLMLGSLGFLRIMVWSVGSERISGTSVYGPHAFLLALVVGMSLIGVVMWGSISGSMLPFVLRRLGLDPATSSVPFVATLVDVTGVVIYFSVAVYILRGTIL